MGALLSMGTPPATSQISGDPKPPAPTTDSELARKVAAAIAGEADLKGARVGVYAERLGAATALVDIGGDQSFNSASNTKIVTIAAALDLLGAGFRFTTALYGGGISSDGTAVKRLYLVGGGDPSLGIIHIQDLARDLVAKGVKTVERIVVDDSYFDSEDLPPHYDEQPREQAAFRAPINAAGLGFNSFAVHVIPNPSGAGAARVVLDPPVDYLRVVESSVTTVGRGRARLRVETTARKGRLDIRVRGQIRARNPRRVRRRVPEPNAFASSVLRWALRGVGIRVESRTFRAADVPPGAPLLASRSSDSLAVLVRGLGKYSNNYMAEMLLKTIGAETDEGDSPATWSAAISAVHGYLSGTVGLETSSFVYENGSGLFKSNRFTPRQMARILSHGAQNPRIGPELQSSLAIGGSDGTLRSRMEETSATGLVRAKTGTLATVSALSGYASSPDGGAPIVFSILINDIEPGHVGAARDLQDAIATMMVENAPL